METILYSILILVLLVICLLAWIILFIITKNKITNDILNNFKNDVYKLNKSNLLVNIEHKNKLEELKDKTIDINETVNTINNTMLVNRQEIFKKVNELGNIVKEHNKEKAELLNLDNSLNKQTATIINNITAQIYDLLRTLEIIKTNTTPKPKTTRTKKIKKEAKISSDKSKMNNCTKSEKDCLKQPKTAVKSNSQIDKIIEEL